MIIHPFAKIVNSILKQLPKNDYPVLNTCLFVQCWLGFALDKSLTSMRDLFKRLNNTGIDVDISTFSKASKRRTLEPFLNIYNRLNQLVSTRHGSKRKDKYLICPIDSTIITLTSKLLWLKDYHQVKLISACNTSQGSLEDNLVNFGNRHDYNYGAEMVASLPPNGVGVMDRGFASLELIEQPLGVRKIFCFTNR